MYVWRGAEREPWKPASGFPVPARAVTAKQLEILLLTANGYDYSDAAQMLGISPRAAKRRMRFLMDTLRASNSAHAVATALRLGEITTAQIILADRWKGSRNDDRHSGDQAPDDDPVGHPAPGGQVSGPGG